MLTLESDRIRYDNGFNATPLTVTRYHGEEWEQVGSDLLCGIADVFPDVGIVVTGKSASVTLEALTHASRDANGIRVSTSDRWIPLDSGASFKATYAFSIENGWLFVPNSREAVEDVISWTMWAAEEPGFISTAFTGYREFRQRLEIVPWKVHDGDLAAFVAEHCIRRALFQIQAGPGTWLLMPGSIEIGQLLRLADPVVARINAALTD